MKELLYENNLTYDAFDASLSELQLRRTCLLQSVSYYCVVMYNNVQDTYSTTPYVCTRIVPE